MASRLKAGAFAAHLVCLPPLAALALVRLWAAVGGRLPGKVIAPLALVAAGLCVFALWRFDVVKKYLMPFRAARWNALAAGAAFALGAVFDRSYAMFGADGLLVAAWPVRVACHVGSGLVFTALVMAALWSLARLRPLGGVDRRSLLVLFLLCNGAAVLYMAFSRTVYAWDNSGYWGIARQLSESTLGLAQLREVLDSVITMDYNYLLALPVSLVMRLFGPSRLVFILSIVNLYLMPGLWGLCILARRGRWGGALLFFCCPALLYIALLGFVDVAAASAAIWAYLAYTAEDRPAAARGLLAGLLLSVSFLLRRYFLFFAISFGVAALLVKLVCERRKWADFGALFCGAAVTAVFFTQSFLVEKILSVQYGDVYSAYDLGLYTDLRLFTRYFGVLVLAAALLLGIWLLTKRAARPTALLALAQVCVGYVLLTRVQTHGQQHLLLYMPGLFVLLALGLEHLPKWRNLAALALAVLTTGSAFVPRAQPASATEIRGVAVVPSFAFYPPRRADMDELIRMRHTVDSLSAGVEKSVAVVCSSFVINGDIYENVLWSMALPEPERPTRNIYMGTVDKRDGFSWNVLTADYLLVGDPVQTHLGEENQQTMAILAHDVLDGTGLGDNYADTGEAFALNDGVTVRLYKRVSDPVAADYRSISDRLTALYPAYAERYAPPEWVE